MPSASERPEPSPREKLDRLRVLLRRARAFWRGAIAVTVIVAAAGIALILHLPRVYESETLLLVREGIRTGERDGDGMPSAQRLAPKMKDMLLARSRLEGVIRELGLYRREVETRGMVDAVAEMRMHIGFRGRDGDTFLVSYQAESPELAQKVTARLAQSMIDDFVKDHVGRSLASRDFLEGEEKRAEQEVEDRARELAEFSSLHPQFAFDPVRGDATLPGGATAPGRRGPVRATGPVTPMDPELASLYREKARLEAQLGGSGSPGAPAVAPQQIEALRHAQAAAEAELTAAQGDLAEKRQRLTDEHPDLVAARNRVIVAGRSVANARDKLDRALHPEPVAAPAPSDDPAAQALRQRIDAIRSEIARLSARGAAAAPKATTGPSTATKAALSQVEAETEWQRLLRALMEARRHKEDVAARRGRAELDASAVETSGANVMTIVDPAFKPTRPIKPNRRVLAGIAGTFSLLLGLAWAMGHVLLDDVLRDGTDVEAAIGVAPWATVPVEPKPRGASTTALARVVAAPPPVYAAPVDTLDERDVVASEAASHPIVTPPPGHAADRPRPREGANRTLIITPPPAPGGSSSLVVVSPIEHAAPLAVRAVAHDLEDHARFSAPAPRVEGAFHPLDPGLVGPRARPALRLLRHRLEREAAGAGLVVGVTGVGDPEARTRLASQLAATLAESDRARVLLVEADLERPALAARLGLAIAPGAGFSAQMRRRADGARAAAWRLVGCGPSLHVLCEGTDDDRWPGALQSRELAVAIDELRRRYHMVVVAGPGLVDDDATVLEPLCDVLLVVAQADRARAAELRRAVRTLGDRRPLGPVLIDVREEMR